MSKPRTKRVLIVSQHPFPGHPTLDRNVNLLLDSGVQVDVVAQNSPSPLRGGLGRGYPTRPAVRLYTMRQVQRRTPAFWYAIQYLTFLCWAFAVVSYLALRTRYDVVQVDTMPDMLVFATAVPRLRRIPIVLYVFDLMPEMTMERLGVGEQDRRVRLVARLEQAAAHWADRVITVSELFRRALAGRGLDPRSVTLVANSHPMIGFPRREPPTSPLLVMQTSLIERYGVDVAVRALPLLVPRWPDIKLRVIGRGGQLETLIHLAESLGVSDRVSFSGALLPWREAMNEVRQATVGIVAIRSESYGDLILPNKVLEMVALEVPVVCSRVRGIREHFPESTLAYFDPGDHLSLATQVARLLANPEEASRQAERAKAAMEPLTWEQASQRYVEALGVVDRPATVSGSVRAEVAADRVGHPLEVVEG
jgi:glycosyltransferase involved in cell wall biosynthesis